LGSTSMFLHALPFVRQSQVLNSPVQFVNSVSLFPANRKAKRFGERLPTSCLSSSRLVSLVKESIEQQPLEISEIYNGSLQRVMVLTDLHTDRSDNMLWVEQTASRHEEYSNDVLLVCGDVSDTDSCLKKTLKALRNSFGHVFFTPGNHDIWVRRDERQRFADSVDKLCGVVQFCQDNGIYLAPSRVGGVWIVPLWSWHHESFDKEPSLHTGKGSLRRYIKDYTACKWPEGFPGAGRDGSIETAEWFDGLNALADARLEGCRSGEPTISFSHFLPLQQLMPEKRFLYLQCLPSASGSDPLGERVRQLRPDVHCFGHTHFSWDQTVDGVRYIQAPLCYPSERRRRPGSLSFRPAGGDSAAPDAEAAPWLPLTVHRADARGGGFVPQLSAAWSDYYACNARDPDNLKPAPWVVRRQLRRERQRTGS